MTDQRPASGLSIERVSFSRSSGAGSADRLIIDGVDCTLPQGSFGALVGPNGAGKSTLLHLIASIERAAGGEIDFDGASLPRMRRRERARMVAVAEQQSGTELDLGVFDVVMLGRTPHRGALAAPTAKDAAIVHRALQDVGATDFTTRRFHSLSGGERQRVTLARALAQEPALLLADEPTNHLDIRSQLSALSLLAELARGGITVLAALHDLSHAAAYADQVIVLAGGRVVAAGAPSAVLTPDLILDVYGVRAEVLEHPLTGRPLLAFAENMPAALDPSLHREPQP
ncbi:MAG: ATP-binding cassette domain-containing protein [Leifsonia sp.]